MKNKISLSLAASVGLLTVSLLHSGGTPMAQADTVVTDSANLLSTSTSAILNLCKETSNGELLENLNCVLGSAFTSALDEALDLVNERGQNTVWFREHFRIDNQLSFVPGEGINGDLDAVLPLYGSSSIDIGSGYKALFFQQGFTRWIDENGFRHNDMRYGAVQRFALFAEDDPDVIGVSLFFQQNIERNHGRIVIGTDYASTWGSGTLNYYMPTTGWQAGRSGYEERPLEGIELSLKVDLTTTLGLTMAASRWEASDGSGAMVPSSRLGLNWKPHPWLSFGANWQHSRNDFVESSRNSWVARVALVIPFAPEGGIEAFPRWDGLGLAARNSSASSAADIWRPVENIGRIDYAERKTRSSSYEDIIEGAKVRFLQDSAPTGKSIGLEVSLAKAAPKDVRITVQLQPGKGENPAIPGEDYTIELIEVLIPKGKTRAESWLQLLDNPNLNQVRTLKVTIYHVL